MDVLGSWGVAGGCKGIPHANMQLHHILVVVVVVVVYD